MPVNFDFNDLYAFRALMEYGSFRLAAESICLSQSALSRRIEKLETALGNRLFDRTTRRVTLTLYGQNFAERSEQLLAHVETVLADISQVSKARTGLVTVATVPSAAYYFMPEIIRSFQARYPQVRIRLIDSSVGNVIEAVSSGQADFGLCFAKNLPASIEFTPLADDRYVAACRHDHPLARKTHLSWQAYFEQDYIGLDRVSGNRTLLDRELAHLTPARPSICETRHVHHDAGDGGSGHRHCRRARDVDARRGAFRSPRCAAHRPGGHAYGRPDPPQRPYSVLRGGRAGEADY